jgi:predicted O-methyltransferase YrrM
LRIEVLDFLYTLVRLTKPERVLETGTWLGRSATAIASALRANGIGYLVTIELNGEAGGGRKVRLYKGQCSWAQSPLAA